MALPGSKEKISLSNTQVCLKRSFCFFIVLSLFFFVKSISKGFSGAGRRLGDNVNSTSSSPSSSQKDKKKDVIIVVMFLFEILKFFFFHFQDCTSSNCVLFGWFCD